LCNEYPNNNKYQKGISRFDLRKKRNSEFVVWFILEWRVPMMHHPCGYYAHHLALTPSLPPGEAPQTGREGINVFSSASEFF
jgi:hypothetical protein